MNLFELANPGNWWWVVAAVPIALLYILRNRMRRQSVSTLLFWDQVFEQRNTRSWWQRLRHLLSLLLQLVFVLLLVGALVDPLWSWQAKRRRNVVLILDTSASMKTVENGATTRMELATQAGARLIRSLRDRDQMAILSAAGPPQVAIGMTSHHRSLQAALDSLVATDGPTNIIEAVEMAERLLAERQDFGHVDRVNRDAPKNSEPEAFENQDEIIVITDACFQGAEALTSKPNVVLYGVGNRRDNLGITRYQVRRSVRDVIGYQILADVTNYSDATKRCRIEFSLDDELVDVVPLNLQPGETKTRIVSHTSVEGGRLVATLNVQDALTTDNRAVAILPKRNPVPVLLKSQGNVFLTSVLESIPLVDLRPVDQIPNQVAQNAILVIDGEVPESIPAGQVLVLAPNRSCDLWTDGGPIDDPGVATVDQDSPLTQHVRLNNVLFSSARRLTFQAEAKSQFLIKDPLDNPLMATIRRPAGDLVVLNCELARGDLPLRIAFPVLMKNTIEWFQGTDIELNAALTTGEIVQVGVSEQLGKASTRPQTGNNSAGIPASERERASALADVVLIEQANARDRTRSLVLLSPNNDRIPVTAHGETVTVGPLLQSGVWQLAAPQQPIVDAESGTSSHSSASTNAGGNLNSDDQGDGTQLIACNLSSQQESDLRPRAAVAGVQSLKLLSLGGRSLWFYLTLIALFLITAEWWLYQRRIVG